MQTKFRIIPSAIGEYLGEKCFETEEVCVATNSMSFEDYLECRGFAFISSLFSSEQFDVVRRHIKELQLSTYDFFYRLWELAKLSQTELSAIYNDFIEETKKELWDSREDIYRYFTNQEAYEKLIRGELGDNLLRKYTTAVYLKCFAPAIELAYRTLREIGGKTITTNDEQAFEATREWMIKTRDIGCAFQNADSINKVEYLSLSHDVLSWYNADTGSGLLTTYRNPSRYKLFYNANQIEALMNEAERLYGKNLFIQMGKVLTHWSIKIFWRKCESIPAS